MTRRTVTLQSFDDLVSNGMKYDGVSNLTMVMECFVSRRVSGVYDAVSYNTAERYPIHVH